MSTDTPRGDSLSELDREQLIQEWRDWEPSEEMKRETAVQHRRELEDERLSTFIFDAGTSERVTLRQFEVKYGTDEFSDELVEAARNKGLYSKRTASRIKSMHAKLSQVKAEPISEAKQSRKAPRSPKPKKPLIDQFIKMRYGFVDRVKKAECHHNPTALLMILLKHRSWPGKMDKHHTFTHWYLKKKLIVASRSIQSLAEELGTCERTVRKYLKQLEQNDDIRIEKGEKFGSRRENVYILGKVSLDGKENFYHTLPQ